METAIKLLYEWSITIPKDGDETSSETINGQTVQVTRKVKKDATVKLAIKQPTRRELKSAELFYGKEFNRFFAMGFMPRSILVNRHLDMSGGVLSEKERGHIAELLKKSSGLEGDLARLTTSSPDEDLKKEVESKLAVIRTEIVNLQVANESVFSQTADARAQSQLNTWFALFMVLVEKHGKMVPLFEGDTFEQKEEYMWDLEDKEDELYNKAVPGISKHVNIFISGGDTPEKFRKALEWLDNETKKQLDSEKPAAIPAKVEAVEPAKTEADSATA